MSKAKAKINFEFDEALLAAAKVYAARHHVSLNKLVAGFFATLDQQETLQRLPISTTMQTLIDVSLGKLGFMEASRELGYASGFELLEQMRSANLQLPKLPPEIVERQVERALPLLSAAMLPDPKEEAPAIASAASFLPQTVRRKKSAK